MSASTFPQFLHHGAADGVTGSCHRYIASDELHLLVDCGLFQGEEAGDGNGSPTAIDFDISKLRALIVTHVHIDHIGRLPHLLSAGFTGPIFCSVPSAHLLPLVIEDALKMGFTRDRALIKQFLNTVKKRLMPLDYKKWYVMVDKPTFGLRVRLQRAGHILGSAYVELDLSQRASAREAWQHHRTVFSGDLGAPYAPLLPAPKSPYKADTLIIESTYGNRIHESRRTRKQRLLAVLEAALASGGTVMIPAFSIGRTQEILYEIESIVHDAGKRPSKLDWQELQIIVDSPLAAKFTKVYRKLKPYWDKEALQRVRSGRHPLNFDTLLTVDSHADHMGVVNYLANNKKGAVVIAASGMVAGGRIVNYMQALLEDERHCVLFVGYQAAGTPGAQIQRYGRGLGECVNEGAYAIIEGQKVSLRAAVETIGGYSAHADKSNLLSFVRNMKHWPRQVRVVHGNDEARADLGRSIQQLGAARAHDIDVVLPRRE
ncbi:MAG: MBL fold metallo-hydrolase [Pseudohongiellaceae bacterium]|nr:MBL fold metallo-hydrolase [Pseudohongiellaceae bacterium]